MTLKEMEKLITQLQKEIAELRARPPAPAQVYQYHYHYPYYQQPYWHPPYQPWVTYGQTAQMPKSFAGNTTATTTVTNGYVSVGNYAKPSTT